MSGMVDSPAANAVSSDAKEESMLNGKLQQVPEMAHPTFLEAFRFWLKLGFISFGGPTGQIAIMHQELVDRKKWVSNERFLNALNYCMLLPGPEAQQLAIYVGWLLHRIPGGIVAGALFVIPSIFVLLGLSYVYAPTATCPGSPPSSTGSSLPLRPLWLRRSSASARRR